MHNKVKVKSEATRVAGRIRPIEKSNDHIGNPTRRLPACSTVPQPTVLARALHNAELHNLYASLDITRMIKPS
jgi:hypothetical protein